MTVAQEHHLGYYFLLPASVRSETSVITTLLLSLGEVPFPPAGPEEMGLLFSVNVTWTTHCKMLRKILERWSFQNPTTLLGQTGQLELVHFLKLNEH